MLGESASPDEIAGLRSTLGLDEPLLTQYRAFLSGVARGNLGTSFRFGTPVAQEIRKRLGDTAILAASAMAVAIVFAIPLGILAAVFRGRFLDHAAMTLALAGISMPSFWLGPLLAILFAVRLGWLPVSGSGAPSPPVLPPGTLGAALSALLARMARSSVIEELRGLYVTRARGPGLSRSRRLLRHAFRQSLILG